MRETQASNVQESHWLQGDDGNPYGIS